MASESLENRIRDTTAGVFDEPSTPPTDIGVTVRMFDEPSTPPTGNVPTEGDYGGDGVDYNANFVHSEDFPTREAAIEWAKNIAAKLGFFLTIATQKPQGNGIVAHYLRCDRYMNQKLRDLASAKRKNTKSKGTGCKFRIKVINRRRSRMWFIVTSPECGKHNHELIACQERHQISHLTPEAKKFIREMSEADEKPCDILKAVKKQFPSLNLNIHHIYNYRNVLRKNKSQDDPSVFNSVPGLLNSQGEHSEHPEYFEPPMNTTMTDRPRGLTTRCDPGHDHSPSLVNMTPRSGLNMNVDDFPYARHIRGVILDYLRGWNDVVSDGNCGFRCVADVFHGGEDNWDFVRRAIVNEIGNHPFIYTHIYGDLIHKAVDRIEWEGEQCGDEHHMEVVTDLFPIANFYKCAVMCFAVTPEGLNPNKSVTVLPWYAGRHRTRPTTELTIAHLGRHYIRLQLAHNFPVPPISPLWFEMRHDNADGWEQLYAERRSRWDDLTNCHRPEAHMDIDS